MKALARKTKAVCFGSLAQRSKLSHDTIGSFLDAVPKSAYKIFDINLRKHFYNREVIEYSLSRCNILKINVNEVDVIRELFGWKEQSEIQICRQMIQDYNLKLVILTKGSIGSYVISLNNTICIYTAVQNSPKKT